MQQNLCQSIHLSDKNSRNEGVKEIFRIKVIQGLAILFFRRRVEERAYELKATHNLYVRQFYIPCKKAIFFFKKTVTIYR